MTGKRATPAPHRRETEASFQQAVIDLAHVCGYRVYHTHDSRRSEAGYPDLTLVKRDSDGKGRLLFVELKTDRGRVRPAQQAWLADLAACPGVTAVVWRPAMWSAIVAALMADAADTAISEVPAALAVSGLRAAPARHPIS